MHNVGTVPTYKTHNVGTVPTFKTHNVGTVPTFKTHNVGTEKNKNKKIIGKNYVADLDDYSFFLGKCLKGFSVQFF